MAQAPKLSYWIWHAAWGRIPTKSQLFKRNLAQDMTCPSCQRAPESIHHIIYECQTTFDIRNLLGKNQYSTDRLAEDHIMLHKWSMILNQEGLQNFWSDTLLAKTYGGMEIKRSFAILLCLILLCYVTFMVISS